MAFVIHSNDDNTYKSITHSYVLFVSIAVLASYVRMCAFNHVPVTDMQGTFACTSKKTASSVHAMLSIRFHDFALLFAYQHDAYCCA